MNATERKAQMIQAKAEKRKEVVAYEQYAREERREVFEIVYGVDTFSKIIELFREDYKKVKNSSKEKVAELFPKYAQAIFFLYGSSSIRNNLVKFKKVIQQEKGRQFLFALDLFSLTSVYAPIAKRDQEEKEIYNNATKESTDHYKTIEEVTAQIKEVKQILDTKAYLENKSNRQTEDQLRAYHLAIIIGLSTGRRFTEVMKTLELQSTRKGYFYKGLLKSNDQAQAHFIHLSYKEVNKYIRELRKLVDTSKLTNDQVNKKYSKIFNSATKRIIGESSFKKMRDNFAQALSKDSKHNIDEVLGHRVVLTSGVNYSK